MPKQSAQKPSLTRLHKWLQCFRKDNREKYLYLLLTELENMPDEVWQELFIYMDHAHEGARSTLRAPLGESLNPLKHGKKEDPAYGYPHKLNLIALQGFFGEILTGIITENYQIFGSSNWIVPVYLFRTHVTAFQQLEEMRQTDEWQKKVLGRTGDDGLAFELDNNGDIIRWMACEAKCTGSHNSELINNNHKKLSDSAVTKPVDLLRTIEALQDYADDDYSKAWIEVLRKLFFQKDKIERCDLSVYICGRFPVRNKTWIPTTQPHKAYTATRKLTSVEVQINDLIKKIQELYKRMDNEK